jgi:hypothetical protein
MLQAPLGCCGVGCNKGDTTGKFFQQITPARKSRRQREKIRALQYRPQRHDWAERFDLVTYCIGLQRCIHNIASETDPDPLAIAIAITLSSPHRQRLVPEKRTFSRL